jgi:transcription antitermination protein NusB
MGLRHLARQRALQLLYGLEFNRLPYEQGEREFLETSAKHRKPWSAFAGELARRTYAEREKLDAQFGPLLEKWKIERIPLTDRICLRMAVCELENFPDIPLRATLNEYVELARLFGTEDSPKYINGVLNRIGERFAHKDFERNTDPDALPRIPPDVESAPAGAVSLMPAAGTPDPTAGEISEADPSHGQS